MLKLNLNRIRTQIRRREFTASIFGGVVGGILGAPRPALAADPDFSLVIVPDPQYLAESCSAGYSAMMQWIVNNQSLSVGGSSLNIKGVISVGDCVNQSQSGQRTAAASAWGVLDSNSFPYMIVPGNHDYTNAFVTIRANLQAHFALGGTFAPAARSAQSYWGGALPGGGGNMYWGGAYDTTGANTYIRLVVGNRKILIIGLEFFARSAVLNWARSIHDTYQDHEVIITTHSYIQDSGDQVIRGTGGLKNLYGPDNYDPGDNSMTAAPGSNSGLEMWGGSAASPTWSGFTTWPNLRMILCGHWIYNSSHTGGTNTPWYYQRVPITSTSPNGQTVQQIFYNEQELDNAIGCPGGVQDGTSDTAHLFFLKIKAAGNTLEGYALSTNSGKWTGNAGSSPGSSPVQLFSVSYPTPIVGYSGHQTRGKTSYEGKAKFQ